jgi:hypothetical protein
MPLSKDSRARPRSLVLIAVGVGVLGGAALGVLTVRLIPLCDNKGVEVVTSLTGLALLPLVIVLRPMTVRFTYFTTIFVASSAGSALTMCSPSRIALA